MVSWVPIVVVLVIVLILIVAGIAWWWYATGCGSNADCAPGLFCSNGRCVPPECRTQADCRDPARPICNNGVCQPKPTCTSTSTCPAGEVCSITSRVCVSPAVVDRIVQIPCDAATAVVPGLDEDKREVQRSLFPSDIQVGHRVVVTWCSQEFEAIRRPAINWYAEVIAVPSSYSDAYLTVRRLGGELTVGQVFRDITTRESLEVTGFSSRDQAIFNPTP